MPAGPVNFLNIGGLYLISSFKLQPMATDKNPWLQYVPADAPFLYQMTFFGLA